jgi:predicted aspartyl protease
MKSITFENEHHYDGNKAFVSIRILGRSIEINLDMVLDTGAVLTVLNRKMIPVLGINVEMGDPIEVMVANKDVATGYVHEVEIDFLGRKLSLPAVICPDWDTQNLLGMQGFFDQMVVAFDHAERRVYF